MQHLHFLVKKLYRHFQPLGGIELAQKFCLVREVNTGILGYGIGQEAVIAACQHLKLNQLSWMLAQFQILGIQPVSLPAQRPGAEGVRSVRTSHRLYNTREIRFTLLQFRNPGAADSRNQDTGVFILGTKNLLNADNRPNGIQIRQLRVVLEKILLWNQHENLVFLHSGIQGVGRFCPAYLKMHGLLRKYRKSTQGKNRHLSCINHF